MILTIKERRSMKKRFAGIHAEIGARFAQGRRDADSVQHLAHLRKIEAAMLLTIAGG